MYVKETEKSSGYLDAPVLSSFSNVSVLAAGEPALEVAAPSYVLMEPETGTVICGKEMDTRRSPASVTKIMTLLLIFDHLENGTLDLSDTVTTSAHAKSMGGSQVFLEEGETQTAETMIKCIVIASGNDASVAMAEHIAGSEQEFVKEMNERAAELGMKNTFRGLLRTDRFRQPLYDRLRYRAYEQRADPPLSSGAGIFFYLDGKHYTCNQTGNQGIRAYKYE